MLLIHHQTVQFHERHLGGHRVETVLHQWILEKIDQERFVFPTYFNRGHDRFVRATGFFFFQRADMILRILPFLDKSPFAWWLDRFASDEAEKPFQGWPPDQI